MANLQNLIVLMLVAIAGAYVLSRLWRRTSRHCGGGCEGCSDSDCPSEKSATGKTLMPIESFPVAIPTGRRESNESP